MGPATIRQCAVLMSGTVIAGVPGPLFPVGGRPFLAWLLRELARFGVEEAVLLAGGHAERMQHAVEAIAASLPRPLRIIVAEQPQGAGSGGTLHHVRDRLDAHFLLCNGESLLAGNLARLLGDAAADGPEVIGRLALRREPPPDAPAPSVADAGICRFDRRVLDRLRPACSLEDDILPMLAREGALRGTVLDGYFIDPGLAADRVRAMAELPRRLARPALFLDRDGVINRDHGWVGTRARFEWMPGIKRAIRDACDAGWHVFVVTNQSGIARGHYTEDDLAALHGWMADALRRAGGTIDDIRFCPFHPDAPLAAYRQTSNWRKPGPGMILDIIRHWQLDPARCILVGDQPTDLAAAKAAGIAAQLFDGTDVVRCLAEARQAGALPRSPSRGFAP